MFNGNLNMQVVIRCILVGTEVTFKRTLVRQPLGKVAIKRRLFLVIERK